MKSIIYLLLFIISPSFLFSQTIVKHQGIRKTLIDLSSLTTLGEVSINPTVSGKVIVHFDGRIISTPGDRIILAASDDESWGVDDGNVAIKVLSSSVDRKSFSHTRVYDVNPGSQSFYAVAQNYVEYNGDGIASIYGTLTVKFIPDGSSNFVSYQSIRKPSTDLNPLKTLGEITINPTIAGKAIVRFDGYASSTPGDRIILAASDDESWGVNDGSISVRAINSDVKTNSFSHTRVYDVNPGSQTFYAMGQNYVNTGGDGIATIYGSFTVEFIPETNDNFVNHLGIAKNSIDLSSLTNLGEVTINPTIAGKVIVRFDGKTLSTPGDRIILAASDNESWGVDDGSISVKAANSTVNRNCFSHSRVYDVNPGSQTFYAMVQNYVNTSGDGIASIYGSLTVEFIGNSTTGLNSEKEEFIALYPNPSNDFIQIKGLTKTENYKTYNSIGVEVSNGTLSNNGKVNIKNLPNGLYFLELESGNRIKFVIE